MGFLTSTKVGGILANNTYKAEFIYENTKKGAESFDKKKDPFIIEDPLIEMPETWDAYVDEPLTEKELGKLQQSVNRQSPYG